MSKKITFIVPYPYGEAPSQRFRFEQYYDAIRGAGFEIETKSFLSINTWNNLYKKGNVLAKFFGICKGFAKRFGLLFQLGNTAIVFIHREITPVGPPIFEFIIAKILRKKIIYDFDDAIWIKNTSGSNRIVAWLKWHGKVKHICKWATVVSTGNDYLASFARLHAKNVVKIPTTIDTSNLHNSIIQQKEGKLTIGWTGTHSTMKYLNNLIPVLDLLAESVDFEFLVISNEQPSFQRGYLNFLPWNKTTEITDLLKFDIGVMPLENDLWSGGKCGFKALQYMALGIPSIVSPVGVNAQIIKHQVNGLLADSQEEWFSVLQTLINSPLLRSEFGAKGLTTVKEQFSVVANEQHYLNLVQSLERQ